MDSMVTSIMQNCNLAKRWATACPGQAEYYCTLSVHIFSCLYSTQEKCLQFIKRYNTMHNLEELAGLWAGRGGRRKRDKRSKAVSNLLTSQFLATLSGSRSNVVPPFMPSFVHPSTIFVFLVQCSLTTTIQSYHSSNLS